MRVAFHQRQIVTMVKNYFELQKLQHLVKKNKRYFYHEQVLAGGFEYLIFKSYLCIKRLLNA